MASIDIHTPRDRFTFDALDVDVTDCRMPEGGFIAPRLKLQDMEVVTYLHNDSQRSLFIMALQELASKLQDMPIDQREADAYTCDCCPADDEAGILQDVPAGATSGPWLRTDLDRYQA